MVEFVDCKLSKNMKQIIEAIESDRFNQLLASAIQLRLLGINTSAIQLELEAIFQQALIHTIGE